MKQHTDKTQEEDEANCKQATLMEAEPVAANFKIKQGRPWQCGYQDRSWSFLGLCLKSQVSNLTHYKQKHKVTVLQVTSSLQLVRLCCASYCLDLSNVFFFSNPFGFMWIVQNKTMKEKVTSRPLKRLHAALIYEHHLNNFCYLEITDNWMRLNKKIFVGFWSFKSAAITSLPVIFSFWLVCRVRDRSFGLAWKEAAFREICDHYIEKSELFY